VSPRGAELSIRAMELFRDGAEKIFANMSKDDEKRLTEAVRTLNSVLENVELNNE
jgi:hypothetical protein